MRKFKELSKLKKVMCIIAILVVVSLIAVAAWYWIAADAVLSRYYYPDIVLSSPDGKYEIVAREWGYLVGGGTEIHFRKAGQDKWYNSWLEKEVGELPSQMDHPISAGFYDIKWDDDKVTIYFPRRYGKDSETDRSTWRGILTYEFK